MSEPSPAESNGRARWLAFAVLYTAFVVYGSLVPLDYRPTPFAEAWERFEDVPFLHLSLYSRADWIANGVLFVPIGFSFCAASGVRQPAFRMKVAALVVLVASLAAIGLEFVQVYFPRTVSRNDIYAEIIGAGAGASLWLVGFSAFTRLLRGLTRDLAIALRSVAALYLLLYLAVNLFPFDLVLSGAEMRERWQNRPPALLPSDCASTLRCAIHVVVEILAAAPLALLFPLLGRARGPRVLAQQFALGAGLGLFLETAQLFTFSGTVSAFSVLTRGVGVVLGALTIDVLGKLSLRSLESHLRRAALVTALPYLLLLMAANHWSTQPVSDLDGALAKLASLRFIPFYYHYFAPENTALQKLLYHFTMYVPVGLAWWLFALCAPHRPSWWAPAMAGAGLAAVMAGGRLFLDTARPDPTNVAVAFAAAGIAYVLAGKLWRMAAAEQGPVPDAASKDAARREPEARPESGSPGLARRACAVIVLLLTAFAALEHPVYPFALFMALGIYALLLMHIRWLWLLAVPACLPVLDFTPQTGWFVFDELDLLLSTTVGVGLWTTRWRSPERTELGLGAHLLALFLISTVVSALLGLAAAELAFSSSLLGYDGPQNTLRLLKGVVWPIALLPFLIALLEERPERALPAFSFGASLGLTAGAAAILWERQLFTGLFDFQAPFRASGNFSSMHVGGASFDAFLVMTLPFLGYAAIARHRLWTLPAMAVLPAAAYAVLVTYTRTTHAAALVAGACVVAGLSYTRGRFVLSRGVLPAAGFILLLIALFAAVRGGDTYFEHRWRSALADTTSHLQRWSQLASLRADSLAESLLGAGLGRLPARSMEGLPESARPGRALIVREDDDDLFLRLGGGLPVYVDQRVPVSPLESYTLSAELRAHGAPAELGVYLCEKHLMNSRRCTTARLKAEHPGEWQHVGADLGSGPLGSARGPLSLDMPTYLGIATPRPGSVVDVDNVSLEDSLGRELLRNGEFSHGRTAWFFTQDEHLVWQAKNLWVSLLFEQGWLGAGAFTLLLLYTFSRLAAGIGGGKAHCVLLCASLLAATVMGMTDTLLNAERVTLLLFLVIMMSLLTTASHRHLPAPPAPDSPPVRPSAELRAGGIRERQSSIARPSSANDRYTE